jgi:hypothetical protein
MRILRLCLLVCLCLLPSSLTLATDNSFKLDFDGDGRTDIALYREGTRGPDAPQSSWWYFFNTQTGATNAIQWGRSLDVPAPADYDGDGKTDVGIFRWWDYNYGDTSEWWLHKGATNGHVVLFGLELGYFKFSRNYIGDAAAEVGQIYPVDISQIPGQNCFVAAYFIASPEGIIVRKTVGDVCNVNPTPVPGDYDNDGHSEIAVFVNRTFKVWFAPYNPGYTAPNMSQFLDVDVPTPGDFDGDGKTDFAGVKNQSGRMVWRIKLSSTGAMKEEDFGFWTDKPTPGDYDGDGKTDIAIYRPANGTWWIINSGTNVIQTVTYGEPNDAPLATPIIPFSPV